MSLAVMYSCEGKLGGKELETTGPKSAIFYRPGRGVTSPWTVVRVE